MYLLSGSGDNIEPAVCPGGSGNFGHATRLIQDLEKITGCSVKSTET